MITDHPSANHGPRPEGATIDMLVLHYTGMSSAAHALARLCDPQAKVSAHYFIDEDGTVLRLVPETRRAWHAGIAHWRGNDDINSRSVGIELVNPGHEHGYRPFPDAQMASLLDLARDIVERHGIEPRNVVGHSDIAPDRKIDPGELFDWPLLAREGIGLWPEESIGGIEDMPEMLAKFGYDPNADLALHAFQRRFRPAKIDGVADLECARRLAGLMSLID